MPTNTVSVSQFLDTTTQAASQFASGWSEAARNYTDWVSSVPSVGWKSYSNYAVEVALKAQTDSADAAATKVRGRRPLWETRCHSHFRMKSSGSPRGICSRSYTNSSKSTSDARSKENGACVRIELGTGEIS